MDTTIEEKNYGVYGTPLKRSSKKTGAGNPLDEDDLEDDDSSGEGRSENDFYVINQETEGEIRHEPVPVPDHNFPFDDKELILFTKALENLQESGELPSGYGLCPEEWDDLGYPAFGTIHASRRGRKELQIALPDHVWRPRAERWGIALYLMNQIMYSSSWE